MQKMLSYVRRAVDHYHMIDENDHIAIGVSGGKDSLTLLRAMAGLMKFYPKKFRLTAITLELGYDEMDFSPVGKLCNELEIDYICLPTQIKQIIFDTRHEPNPCSLCSKMRRGALNDAAVKAGCNKVALGHHFDDVVETLLLSLFYEGRFSCFQPVSYLDRTGITVIRPLIYTPESYVRSFANRFNLPIVKNPCPADGNTQREAVKNLLKSLEKDMPGLRNRLFGAIQRYPLKGWTPDRSRSKKPENESK